MDPFPKRPPGGHPWLDLRDAVTDLVVEGLEDPEAAAALGALGAHLAAPAHGEGARLAGGAASRLRRAGIIDGEGRLTAEAERRRAFLEDRCQRAARARAGLAAAQPPDVAGIAPEVLATVWLVRAGLYFEAHDQLEAHWRRARGDAREFYQGVIQVAVALAHLASGNAAGAASLLESALEKLEGLGPERAGLDLEALRAGAARALEAVRRGATDPSAIAPPLVAARRA